MSPNIWKYGDFPNYDLRSSPGLRHLRLEPHGIFVHSRTEEYKV